MKVSVKEYKQIKNLATGYLLNGILWTFYFGVTGVRVLRDYQNGEELDTFNTFFVCFWLVIGIPVSIWRWRKEERRLKEAEVVNSVEA